ncbi:hypothetical protein CUMW_118400 [Citrus unshiu]|nr:hypothetical protein CUMW_118400 [Citrus unshiu]
MALKYVFFILALTCLIMTNIANATSRNDRLNNNMKPCYDLAIKLEGSGLLERINGAEIMLILTLIVAALLISSPPAMLTSLGFTAEEGNILRGYCDASSAPSPVLSQPTGATPPNN